MWVRLAIVDDTIAQKLYDQCAYALDLAEETHNILYQKALALHYIRALGARQLVNKVVEQLSNEWFVLNNPLFELELDFTQQDQSPDQSQDQSSMHSHWHQQLIEVEHKRDGISQFPPLTRLYTAPTMAQTVLNLVHEIALGIDPIRAKLVGIVSVYLANDHQANPVSKMSPNEQIMAHLRTWLWDQWRNGSQDELMLSMAYHCVLNQPKRAENLALRLALVSPNLAEKACYHLQALPDEQKSFFASSLEKQLKRVGKIKLWVACRTLLKLKR